MENSIKPSYLEYYNSDRATRIIERWGSEHCLEILLHGIFPNLIVTHKSPQRVFSNAILVDTLDYDGVLHTEFYNNYIKLRLSLSHKIGDPFELLDTYVVPLVRSER